MIPLTVTGGISLAPKQESEILVARAKENPNPTSCHFATIRIQARCQFPTCRFVEKGHFLPKNGQKRINSKTAHNPFI